MAIWKVSTEASLRDAVRLSAAGDTIMVRAGDYHLVMAPTGRHDIKIDKTLNIVGEGGRANFHLDGKNVEKGIFSLSLTKDETVTFDNIGFYEARNTSWNGAGIRQDGGNLNVKNGYFENSNMGILSVTQLEHLRGDVHVTNTEFNMAGTNGYSHAMYVLADDFVVENSYVHDTIRGHHVKSVSANTVVRNSVLDDGNGTSSYAVDVEAGGNLLIEGNTIIQRAGGENPSIISYGSARFAGEPGAVLIQNNVFKSIGMTGAKLLYNRTDAEVKFFSNSVEGINKNALFNGLFTQQDNSLNGALLEAYNTRYLAIIGSDGADTMTALLYGTSPLDARGGNDKVFGSASNDKIFAGLGNDFVYGKGQKDQIYGEDGNDILLGGTHDDSVFGGLGNDIVFDVTGINILWGGVGNDVVYGGRTDQVEGNAGNDIVINSGIGISGGRISGGDGNDIIFGREGGDTVSGGKGIDVAVYTGVYANYKFLTEYGLQYIENLVAPDATSDTGVSRESIDGIEMLQFSNGYMNIATRTFHSGQFLFNYAGFMQEVAKLDGLTLAEIDASAQQTAALLQQVYISLSDFMLP